MSGGALTTAAKWFTLPTDLSEMWLWLAGVIQHPAVFLIGLAGLAYGFGDLAVEQLRRRRYRTRLSSPVQPKPEVTEQEAVNASRDVKAFRQLAPMILKLAQRRYPDHSAEGRILAGFLTELEIPYPGNRPLETADQRSNRWRRFLERLFVLAARGELEKARRLQKPNEGGAP